MRNLAPYGGHQIPGRAMVGEKDNHEVERSSKVLVWRIYSDTWAHVTFWTIRFPSVTFYDDMTQLFYSPLYRSVAFHNFRTYSSSSYPRST